MATKKIGFINTGLFISGHWGLNIVLNILIKGLSNPAQNFKTVLDYFIFGMLLVSALCSAYFIGQIMVSVFRKNLSQLDEYLYLMICSFIPFMLLILWAPYFPVSYNHDVELFWANQSILITAITSASLIVGIASCRHFFKQPMNKNA